MTNKLEFDEGVRIVQTALKAVRPCKKVSFEDKLSVHIPKESDRKLFRKMVVKLVNEAQYSIGKGRIPILLATTLNEVAKALATFALPGVLGELGGNSYAAKLDEESELPPPTELPQPTKPRKDIASDLPGDPSAPKSDDEPEPAPSGEPNDDKSNADKRGKN